MHIRFNKTDRFIRIYDGTRYLKLFGSEKYDAIYDRITYLISLKSEITYIFSHYFAKIKVDFYDFLPIEKVLTLHNAIILIKSVLNNNKSHYCYKMFLEKCLHQLAKKESHKFFRNIIMLKFEETKVTREKFYATKKPIKIWDVNFDNIFISKSIKTKTNFKYLIGYLDKVIKPIVLIIPKMSGYIKIFKVKDENKDKDNKLMSFHIHYKKLLEKYKAICTKIEN